MAVHAIYIFKQTAEQRFYLIILWDTEVMKTNQQRNHTCQNILIFELACYPIKNSLNIGLKWQLSTVWNTHMKVKVH